MDAVDEMIEKLDARCAETGERWDLHRLAIGGWRAYAWDPAIGPNNQDPAAVGCSAPRLSEALAGLLATPRLPVVPRQPPTVAGAIVIRKDGSTWDVFEDGQRIGWERTKREAQERADRYEQAVRDRYEAWVSTWWSVVESGVEGRDFYWR